jgi:hypothetical protein
MDDDKQKTEAEPPYGSAIVACIASWLFVHLVAYPFVERLGVWWAELLIYALISISVTFVILYRSCWHRELVGAVRTLSLVAMSSLIFVCFLVLGGGFLLVLFAVFHGITRWY